MAALLMRAHKLRFLTDNQHTYLWKQISARGYRLREPPELDFERERPDLLGQIVTLHLNGLGYSVGDLSRFLCVHEREFWALYPTNDRKLPKAKLTVIK